MMDDTFLCSRCGEETPSEDGIMMDDQMLCPDCAEVHTVLCHHCGQRIWREDNAGDEDTPLCQDCREQYYDTCSHCGCLIPLNDVYDSEEGDPLCWECHNRFRERRIHDYYYKPAPIFYGTSSRFFGVELEIDQGGEYSKNAGRILDLANEDQELLYCKHDGSLEDGFELVTHPMTLDFHQTEMPWQEILDQAVSMGYRSHQAQTCGLHCHVNRDSLGDTEKAQDRCIARILYFFEKHWCELLKFSRRTQRQLDRWAARYGYKEHPMEILDEAKKGYGGGRYSSVNLQNEDTIEFRIFRGTLKYNTIIATLQLVNRVCDVAFALSDEEVKALSWTAFVSSIQEPELIQYLKERRLYVSEPVENEEEL